MIGIQVERSIGRSIGVLLDVLTQKKSDIQQRVLHWGQEKRPYYPWRQFGKTPYEVLIGEICLKQAIPADAVRIYDNFIQRFASIQTLARAAEDEVANLLSEFGLHRHAGYIRSLAENLIRTGKGDMPKGSELFLKASGLGHPGAKAVLCFGYGLTLAIVDSNTERLLWRVFCSHFHAQPAKGLLCSIGEYLLPEKSPQHYNAALLDLGEFICLQAQPACRQCPLNRFCDFAEGTSAVL